MREVSEKSDPEDQIFNDLSNQRLIAVRDDPDLRPRYEEAVTDYEFWRG